MSTEHDPFPTCYQAQCQACGWSSVAHLDKKCAAEDGAIHQNAWGHLGIIATIRTPERIKPEWETPAIDSHVPIGQVKEEP